MIFNKKAISPVVATALLLVVAVVAVVGFQTWFNTYQSGLNVKVEEQSATGSAITIEMVDASNIYLKNSGTTNITASSIAIDGGACTLADFDITSGVAGYSTAGCVPTQGLKVVVTVVTNDGVFTETELVR